MSLKGFAQIFFIFQFQVLFLLSGCGDIPKETHGITKNQRPESIPLEATEPHTPQNASQDDHSSTDIDWGMETDLDEMISMAKNGRIVDIEWHVLPNILRARTGDGGIFHLKNENKGVDLRNTLIKSGVKIGKEGVLFSHVF